MSNVKGDKGFYLQLKRKTNEPLESQYQQDIDNLVKQALGLGQVMNLMLKHKSIIVAHNGFLDLCHIYGKFINPLPEKLGDFKREILKAFGGVMDTKYIVETYGQLKQLFPGTSLEECYKSITGSNLFEKGVEISLELNHKDYHSEKFHEAGYDAYLTGCIYIRVAEYIGSQRDKDYHGSLDFSHLKDFENTLYIFMNDVHLNLCLETPKQDRSHVFYMFGLTEDVNNDSIRGELKDYGRIRVDWINGDSCYVSLEDKTKIDLFVKAIAEKKHKYQIKSFNELKGIIEDKIIVDTDENPRKRKRIEEGSEKEPSNGCIIC